MLLQVRDSTIAAADTSQQVLAGRRGRKYLLIANPSTAAGLLFYDFDNDATADSLSIPAGEERAWIGDAPENAVHLRSATLGAKFIVHEA